MFQLQTPDGILLLLPSYSTPSQRISSYYC